MGLATLLAILLGGAVAQEPMRPPPDGGSADAGRSTPPLSKEDAELVKDLAVLERLELLKNLELFEEPKPPPPEKQDQTPQ